MSADTKPGYKTVAFWAGLALTAISFLVGGDVVEGGTAGKIAAILMSLGASAGYAAWRTFVKNGSEKKKAWKTTEFWLSLGAVAVGGLYAAGIFKVGGPADQALGVVTMILAGLGYQVNRPGKAAA